MNFLSFSLPTLFFIFHTILIALPPISPLHIFLSLFLFLFFELFPRSWIMEVQGFLVRSKSSSSWIIAISLVGVRCFMCHPGLLSLLL